MKDQFAFLRMLNKWKKAINQGTTRSKEFNIENQRVITVVLQLVGYMSRGKLSIWNTLQEQISIWMSTNPSIIPPLKTWNWHSERGRLVILSAKVLSTIISTAYVVRQVIIDSATIFLLENHWCNVILKWSTRWVRGNF